MKGAEMNVDRQTPDLRHRKAPLRMSGDEFRVVGHRLVDQIAEFLDGLPQRPVTPAESPQALQKMLGGGVLPEHGAPAQGLVEEAAGLLFDHSLFNGHPRFWGYITSSAAPIGTLGAFGGFVIPPILSAFVRYQGGGGYATGFVTYIALAIILLGLAFILRRSHAKAPALQIAD